MGSPTTKFYVNLNNCLGQCFLFHSNLTIKRKTVKKFPKFYQKILTKWRNVLSSPPSVLSAVVSQVIWCNKYLEKNNIITYSHYF